MDETLVSLYIIVITTWQWAGDTRRSWRLAKRLLRHLGKHGRRSLRGLEAEGLADPCEFDKVDAALTKLDIGNPAPDFAECLGQIALGEACFFALGHEKIDQYLIFGCVK